jgi:predicted HTH transcriptional regulator
MPATPPSPGPVAERGEADELDAVVYRSLEDRQQDVIDLLVGGGQQTRRQLQTALGWSRSTLRKVLEALIVESKVTPSGESARSPFRTYGVGPGPELAGVRTDRKPLDRAR